MRTPLHNFLTVLDRVTNPGAPSSNMSLRCTIDGCRGWASVGTAPPKCAKHAPKAVPREFGLQPPSADVVAAASPSLSTETQVQTHVVVFASPEPPVTACTSAETAVHFTLPNANASSGAVAFSSAAAASTQASADSLYDFSLAFARVSPTFVCHSSSAPCASPFRLSMVPASAQSLSRQCLARSCRWSSRPTSSSSKSRKCSRPHLVRFPLKQARQRSKFLVAN